MKRGGFIRNQKLERIIVVCLLLALAFVGTRTPIARAANVNAGDASSLIAAITTANGNGEDDTITLTADITLTAVDNTTTGANGLPVILADSGHSLTIEGDGFKIYGAHGVTEFRILEVATGAELYLRNMTLRDGDASAGFDGGALYNNGGTVEINDSTVTNNYADLGGALSNNVGTVTLDNTTIEGNRTQASAGGGIYNAATLIVENSIIANNKTPAGGYPGGGILNDTAGMLTVDNTTFEGNTSSGNGAAISNNPPGTITNSRFINNSTVSVLGGGALSNFSVLTISNSTFSGNHANHNGGAIYQGINGNLTVTNSTFYNNSAGDNGGGIWNAESAVLVNSTFAANSGTDGGTLYTNAVMLHTGATTLFNTIVSDSTGGADCFDVGSATTTADAYNLDTDGTCDNATQKTVAEIDLQPLANNGGPTETMALTLSSLALDAGDDSVCAAVVGDPTYGAGGLDQRGVTRPQGAHCDVGAYEFSCDDISFPFSAGTVNELAVAIDCANANATADTVNLTNDITLTTPNNYADGNNGLPSVTSQITVEGAGHFIERDSGAAENFRIFHNAATGDLTLNELTVRGGRLDGSFFGAAVFNADGGALTITDSTITDNRAGSNGGGIFSGTGTLTVSGTTLSDNGVLGNERGGAIYNSGEMHVTDSTFTNNQGFDGGGIWTRGDSRIDNSTFEGNHSQTDGGGIEIGVEEVVITNSTFHGNTAVYYGGAISNGSTLTLVNSTVSGNSAGYSGGVYNGDQTTLNNVTITGNTSGGGSGSVENDGTITSTNTLIVNETATTDCFNSGGTWLGTNSLDSDGSCAALSGGFETATTVGLDVLANYGGSTKTHALLPDSDAIDVGDNTACADTNSVNHLDQRGKARDDLQCDIGAFELKYADSHKVTVAYDTNNTDHSFGPTLAIITPTSGAPISLTVTITPTAYTTPTPPANALPIQWDATASGSPFSLIVTLCYDPAVLSGQTESTLAVYHYNGSSWDSLGGTLDTATHAPYHCITATSALTGLSPLSLAPSGTTAVTVKGFSGQVVGGKAVLKWRTTSEAQIAGFNLYRKAGKGKFKQINAKFRAAKHAGDAAGAKYRYADKKVKKGKTYRYKIQIVYLDGHTEWTHTVRVQAD